MDFAVIFQKPILDPEAYFLRFGEDYKTTMGDIKGVTVITTVWEKYDVQKRDSAANDLLRLLQEKKLSPRRLHRSYRSADDLAEHLALLRAHPLQPA